MPFYNIFHTPGQPYAPCAGDCQHLACYRQKLLAKKHCTICGQPIGYEREFEQVNGYVDRFGYAGFDLLGNYPLIHRDCKEKHNGNTTQRQTEPNSP